ncbi:hypothetical protein IU459_15185 [Nocardia amamiensis]|uniref:Metallo-beta-lactamase domain-containing protein n=1 Tax=Nocardia amamiensis TaxID=404578 RepID=A0ABS0CSP3_9NOCA|nr:hypothetical protein [Nocardia amamiensis]MBF6298878.1 hypothetical protein [Nocardia amamiensis]
MLFTGDTPADARGVTMPGVFDADSAAVERAAIRLAELDVETICVGHGDVRRGWDVAARQAPEGGDVVPRGRR